MNKKDEPSFGMDFDQGQDGELGFEENSLEAGSQDFNDMTQSDLVEAETAEAAYDVKGKTNNIQRSTMIIMVTCLLGVGGIYLFSTKNKPSDQPTVDTEIEAKVDVALAKLQDHQAKAKSQKLFKDSEDMVKTFYEYPAKQQVKLDELQRDPFAREVKDAGPIVESDDVIQARLRRKLNEQLVNIKLQSVLQGPSGGRCLINGTVYGLQQIVLDTFTIKDIQDEKVILEAEGLDFELTM